MTLLQMAFIVGLLGPLGFLPMSAINHQNFSVCRRLKTQSCNTTENLKCSSGKIKISGVSFGVNVGCVNNDSCNLETCCDINNMLFLHNITKDLMVYNNCSFKQECSINLADENFSPSGFVGYMRIDINYTCIEDLNIVKICDNGDKTSDQLELIFDGSEESQRLDTSPGSCKCFVSTNHPNGAFRAFITDIRLRTPFYFYSKCASVILNIFDLPIEDCDRHSFYNSGQFTIDPNFLKTVTMDKLFLTSKIDIPSLVWITVVAMNSSFVTVNCSAIDTDSDYTSFITKRSAKPSGKQTLPKLLTTQDGQDAILLNQTITQVWRTSTDGASTAANSSKDAGNDDTAVLLHVVLPIAGGLSLLAFVLVTVLCTRRRRNKKQMLRTNVSRSNCFGNNDTPFELDNADGVHSCEEMRAPQSRELNLFPNIDTAKATVQGYDHITFEKMPPKRIDNYDMMMASVDFPILDSTYSHVPPETFSSKRFRPNGYSHISFDKTGTGEQLSVRVDTIRESRQTDGYSHIEFESKPSVSITNPIGMSEPTINDNYSYTTIQSTNDTQLSIGSYRPRENVLDRDSSSHVDFNGKQSRADNGLDMTIRIEMDSENYNYAKVNLKQKKKQILRNNMEVMQISQV